MGHRAAVVVAVVSALDLAGLLFGAHKWSRVDTSALGDVAVHQDAAHSNARRENCRLLGLHRC